MLFGETIRIVLKPFNAFVVQDFEIVTKPRMTSLPDSSPTSAMLVAPVVPTADRTLSRITAAKSSTKNADDQPAVRPEHLAGIADIFTMMAELLIAAPRKKASVTP